MNPTIHEELCDRMPEVARGAARWTADESAHLAGCAECRREWELVQVVARLGGEVERAFDPGPIAAGVLGRMAEAKQGSTLLRGRIWIGVAATVALTFVAVRPAGVHMPSTAVPADSAPKVQLAELDSLSDDELALVADGLDAPLTESPLLEGSQLNELDTTDLERVLRSLEG